MLHFGVDYSFSKMWSSDEIILVLYIILFFIIIVFLLIREINCWYWKINERTQKLKNIDKNLQFIVDFIKERQNLEKQENSEKNSNQ